MKYNHQFIVAFQGDSLNTNSGVHVNNNNKICTTSELIKRVYEVFPEKKEESFVIKSYILLLNQ